MSDIGGLAELKRNKTLAVSTPDAYTRRVKETGTITASYCSSDAIYLRYLIMKFHDFFFCYDRQIVLDL